MRRLLDLNVWMALCIPSHPHHSQARDWLAGADLNDGELLFCLPTEMGLLRLLTQTATMGGFGLSALTNDEAIAFLRELEMGMHVSRVESSPSTRENWLKAAARPAPAPKMWMDSYLAALSIGIGAEMVTFDNGFTNYVNHGINLRLLAG